MLDTYGPISISDDQLIKLEYCEFLETKTLLRINYDVSAVITIDAAFQGGSIHNIDEAILLYEHHILKEKCGDKTYFLQSMDFFYKLRKEFEIVINRDKNIDIRCCD